MSVQDYDGVGKKTYQNLKDAGYESAMQIARKKPENLADETSLGEKRAENIVEQAREEIRSGNAFSDGNQVREREKTRSKITTGSDELDSLFGGGIPEGYITEVYGKNSSGKTQLALQLAVNVQLPEDEGGLGKKAVFIDTEDTFTAERITDMAEAKGLDPEEVLSNIYVAKPFDSGDQLDITMSANERCEKEDIGVVITDSIIAHLRAEFSGRGELTERQEILGNILEELKDIASAHETAVFLTNQVHVDPGQMFGDPTKAVGGNILSHNATFIAYLQHRSSNKGDWGKWVAKLKDSPNLPDREVPFTITDEGIADF